MSLVKFKRVCWLAACGFALIFSYQAAVADSFIVKSISIQGLQKIHKSTLMKEYISPVVKVGQRFSSQNDSTALLKALYKSQFFNTVDLERQGSKLIVKVKERPVIASVKVVGNKGISTTRVNEMLKKLSVQKGLIFNHAVLNNIQQGLHGYYLSRGKYDTKINTELKNLSQNRVAITIKVDESKPLVIKSIRVVGGKQYSESQLKKKLLLTTPGLFTYFTDKDKYSSEKLSASLDILRDFYFDEGYIQFKVVSKTTAMTPDRKGVHITVKIDEGDRYTIKGYQFSGQLIVPQKALVKALAFAKGDIFSRTAVNESISNISDLLADRGYSFSTVDVNPDINQKRKQVNINFFIEPGRPVFVRRINFIGNHKTASYVFRRAFRQKEGELLVAKKLRESMRQMRLLTYIDDVSVEQKRVPDANNQIDLDVNVVEGRSTELSVAAGYGTNGFEVNAGINDYNFFGTGSNAGFNFTSNAWGNNYSMSYFNPYYTESGIGRGYNVYFQKQKPGRSGLLSKVDVSPFTTDRFGAAINYSIPFTDTHSVSVSGGYEFLRIKEIGSAPSAQLTEFVRLHDKKFPQIRLGAGWAFSNYDRLPYPTKGYRHSVDLSLALPASKKGLQFYKASYLNSIYYPLFKGFIFHATGQIGFGGSFGRTKALPFYENYYSGGISSEGQVRGYETASLGPKDSNGGSMGGNLLVAGSASIILPKPLSGNDIRTRVFVDAGNVYDTKKNPILTGSRPGHMRLSAGLSLEWRTPIGPLAFSIAAPINRAKTDRKEFFQFTVSHGF